MSIVDQDSVGEVLATRAAISVGSTFVTVTFMVERPVLLSGSEVQQTMSSRDVVVGRVVMSHETAKTIGETITNALAGGGRVVGHA